jgi:hypothetical protein
MLMPVADEMTSVGSFCSRRFSDMDNMRTLRSTQADRSPCYADIRVSTKCSDCVAFSKYVGPNEELTRLQSASASVL